MFLFDFYFSSLYFYFKLKVRFGLRFLVEVLGCFKIFGGGIVKFVVLMFFSVKVLFKVFKKGCFVDDDEDVLELLIKEELENLFLDLVLIKFVEDDFV